jgi:hypothetical protein
MNRILTWYANEIGDTQDRVYYMEQDYIPLHVRIYAREPAVSGDVEIDIKDDGVSIFETSCFLGESDHETEMAEDFLEELTIEQGSWVSFDVKKLGGAHGITVQLELDTADDREIIPDE